MVDNQELTLNLRQRVLIQDAEGRNFWQENLTRKIVAAAKTAIIICDMWDNHWSRGAVEREEAMIPQMNEVIKAARAKGVHIIHAPSETTGFYAGTPARQRMIEAPQVALPADSYQPDPPLPVDASDGGSDTGETEPQPVWRRQHPALEIDQTLDGLSDNGQEIYNFIRQQELEYVLIMGVHTNMCILNRSFGIKQMVRWGINIFLVRDLTDAMYNPARPPYVSHEEGTRLVIEYIEKFWCPSITSTDLR
jgi:nicotinamidase-related amidase